MARRSAFRAQVKAMRHGAKGEDRQDRSPESWSEDKGAGAPRVSRRT